MKTYLAFFGNPADEANFVAVFSTLNKALDRLNDERIIWGDYHAEVHESDIDSGRAALVAFIPEGRNSLWYEWNGVDWVAFR